MTATSLLNDTQGEPVTDCAKGQKLDLDPATPGIIVETTCRKTGLTVSVIITGAQEGRKIVCETCPLPPAARR